MPLFDGQTSADVRGAAAKLSAATVSLAESRATAAQKFKATKSNVDFALQRLEVAKKGFEASKLQAEVSRQRYTLGLLSFQDWDAYESELIKSELDVLSGERDVADAVADFYEAAGLTLEEDP